MRKLANAIFHVLRAGCAWRLLPESFAPWRTVHCWLSGRRDGSALKAINHHLVMPDRERCGREADKQRVFISGQKRGVTLTIRRVLRRRAGIELGSGLIDRARR